MLLYYSPHYLDDIEQDFLGVFQIKNHEDGIKCIHN